MIRRPEDMATAFADAFNTRDLDKLLELFEPDAVLVPDGVTEARGPALREALSGFLALNGPMKMTPVRTVVNGDVALVVGSWTLEGTTPNGPMKLEGTTSDVVRRQPDGSWRYVVDAPFGLKA